MNLNPEQSLVAASRARRTLVQAGAGTGKTAASVGWVSSLIDEGVSARNILMMTFTRKAALEMVTRAVREVGEEARKVIAGTYHSIAVSLIRRAARDFGFGSDRISLMDQNDSRSLWRTAVRECGLKNPVPGAFTVADAVSALRNRNQDVEQGLKVMFGDDTHAVRLANAYEALKAKGSLLDYDDLLVRWRDRLRDDSAYAARLRERFQYVLVDEMQDNNVLQYEILHYINPAHLLVVGDLNQSIYAFRSAEPALMLRFQDENPDAQVIRLQTNYRSGQPILDLANDVIADSEAPIHLTSATGADACVYARQFTSPDAEAEVLCDEIAGLLSRGHAGNTIAVLARASRNMRQLEVELRRAKIEYRKYGGQSVAEAAEVKDFTSFIRLVHNPKDRPALIRALMLFPGVGEVQANKAAESDDFFGSFPKKATEARHWIEDMRTLPFPEAMSYLVTKIEPLIQANYPDNAAERIINLHNLTQDCTRGGFTLIDFIDAFVTERLEGPHPENAITLSTIHSAKGLEWEDVYLIGAGSCQMPHSRTETAEDYKEERRLMYVAVTRARTNLLISYPSYCGNNMQVPSPLLPSWVEWDS